MRSVPAVLLLLSLLVAGCTSESADSASSQDAAAPSPTPSSDAPSAAEAHPTEAPPPGQTEPPLPGPAGVIALPTEPVDGHALEGVSLPDLPDVQEAVFLPVGEDLQAAIDAQSPGTTFVLGAGEHRGQSLVLRDGDTLVGQDGAVLNGAREIDGFVADDGVWVSPGHTEEPSPIGQMDEGWDNEANPHDLFVDGERRRHVLARDDVGPGSYYFDYDADELVLGEDPTGRTVELAVTPVAIAGPGTSRVTVRRVEVRHYAVQAQRAAVDATDTSEWNLAEIRAIGNHGGGIRLGSGTEVRGCWVEGNGQIGVVGGYQTDGDRPMLIEGCNIVDNAQLGFTWRWEAGATKFFNTHGLVFRDNEVIGNDGPGIWFDTRNSGAHIVGNVVRDNAINGVFYELSREALIEGNTVEGNGDDGGALAAGIFVSNSPDVTVRGNTLRDNHNEIVAVQSFHGSDIDIPRIVENLLVQGNDVHLAEGFVGLSVTTDAEELYTDAGNRFEGNSYLLDGCDPCFLWGDFLDVAGWQAVGNDQQGVFRQAR